MIDLRTPFNPVVGSVQVCSVLYEDANGRDHPLRPGVEIPVNQLADGLKVLIRQRVHPDSVSDGTLFVTTEIPYRLPSPYTEVPSGVVVAYQPVVLPAEISLVQNGVLEWRPFAQTFMFLDDVLQHTPPPSSFFDLHERAYQHWESQNYEHGRALDDWLRAERELAEHSESIAASQAMNVFRLANVRFEREFDVFDHGGPASNWGMGQGNIIIQTGREAGTGPDPQSIARPTMAVHRYSLMDNAVYVGLTVETEPERYVDRRVGLVYNWLSPNDYSLYIGSIEWRRTSTPWAIYPYVVMYHIQIRGGQPVAESQANQTIAETNFVGFSLDIKQLTNRLQFGCRVFHSDLSTPTNRPELVDFPSVAELIPGSRLGMLTAGTGTARFTRLQVVYGNDPPVTLIPAGLKPRLLTRLVLKRSLLEVVSEAGGRPMGGIFAGPVPEPDFETWFWVVQPTPGYYGYSYGGSSGYSGIGSGRLMTEGTQ